MSDKKRNYIYTRVFNIKELQDKSIYQDKKLQQWKDDFKIDENNLALFVSYSPIIGEPSLEIKSKAKDIKNKKYFNPKNIDGFSIPSSKMTIDNNIIYLFIINKKKARQNHGFVYEDNIKKLNDLTLSTYVAKWDATGSIKHSFIEKKLKENTNITFNEKNTSSTFSWIKFEDFYKQNFKWNIKCIGDKNSVDLGAFTRISGINKKTLLLEDINFNDEVVDTHFIFNVCFYDKLQHKTEYFIYIDFETWKTYLPEYNITSYKNMFDDLLEHRLIGERTLETEKKWKDYREKYSKISDNSVIKLRFKRDSKGQLRIQSAISFNNFNDIVLKNPHIKIQ